VRAAVLTSPGKPLEITTLEPVGIGPREVVVDVRASGICHSDIGPIEGWREVPLPMVLGHEAAGVVREVGSAVASLRAEDRVIASFVLPCGECWWCVRGEGHLCREGRPLTQTPRLRREDGSLVTPFCGLGSFADTMVADERSLIRVQSSLPDDQLALLGCGITTGVFAALDAAAVRPGDTVAVVGCGGVGQAVVQGARAAGASQIIAIDPVALKRVTAVQSGGTLTVDPTAVDPVEAVREATVGRGVDHTFDVTGNRGAILQAFKMTRRGGALILVGIPHPGEPTPWALAEHFLEAKTVKGCIFGSVSLTRELPRLIALIEAGRIDLSLFVSNRIGLEEINEGIEALRKGTAIRTVIVNRALTPAR
jgi:S-(hydroxymethyl)glutathione dehydrogenase / alcohol dehydrogenase